MPAISLHAVAMVTRAHVAAVSVVAFAVAVAAMREALVDVISATISIVQHTAFTAVSTS